LTLSIDVTTTNQNRQHGHLMSKNGGNNIRGGYNHE
jgi:hypothetical protein